VRYEIGGLRLSDAEIIGSLQNRIWRETYAGLLPDTILAARDDGDNIEIWRHRAAAHERHGRSPEGCTTWVARDETGKPIGWIGLGPARDADAPTEKELWSLNVAPEFHGSGVASLLVDALLPAGPAYLWVLSGNDRAIAFYRKCGFTPDGTMREIREGGALELRMTRS
jgi:RimJ/RimL family protein N-acetyltransferase